MGPTYSVTRWHCYGCDARHLRSRRPIVTAGLTRTGQVTTRTGTSRLGMDRALDGGRPVRTGTGAAAHGPRVHRPKPATGPSCPSPPAEIPTVTHTAPWERLPDPYIRTRSFQRHITEQSKQLSQHGQLQVDSYFPLIVTVNVRATQARRESLQTAPACIPIWPLTWIDAAWRCLPRRRCPLSP
jgi:hypothetical protein